jgi:hypothetical protein
MPMATIVPDLRRVPGKSPKAAVRSLDELEYRVSSLVGYVSLAACGLAVTLLIV